MLRVLREEMTGDLSRKHSKEKATIRRYINLDEKVYFDSWAGDAISIVPVELWAPSYL